VRNSPPLAVQPDAETRVPPNPAAAGGRVYGAAKRAIDLMGSVAMLIVTSPVVIVLCLAISATSRGWPFYRQWRVGKHGRQFRLWKLRTMVRKADRVGPPLTQENDPRVTAVGRFLRRWSLDELPQLINILIGDMSLVGPRPELPSIVATYTPEQREVLLVRPGITGWSQIQGRDDLSIPDKLELDREYVFSRRFGRDLAILLHTVPAVLRGTGVKR
jgi:lipopolysaccharide/colanic/teichoic acid biosynthesis glycosyltransferase